MKGRRQRFKERVFTISVGWLFADLLFALAMLFLLSNTLGVAAKPKPIRPTPTPTMVPTPDALLLDRSRLRLTLTVNNPGALSQGDAQAKAALAQQIRQQMRQKGLQDRRAGLAIVYGGAPGDGDISTAQSIAGQVYSVLDSLGSQEFVFCHTLHYDALYVLGNSLQTVIIDIYLFDASVGNCQSIA